MSEKQETIADIVAEKRERADEIERDVAAKMASGEMVSDQYAREVIADLRREADRLEAAWKRQEQAYLDQIRDAVNMIGHEKYVAEHAQKPTIDNAAAMRAALEIAHDYFNSGGTLRTDAEKAVEAALAVFTEAAENVNSESDIDTGVNKEKPLRNCDKFSDWWEADKAWRALPRDDLGYFVKQNGVLLCEIAWLFETEQKGE